MNREEALQFIAENHQGVLSTNRRDGRPALTPVTAGVNADKLVVVSTRATALKVHNIERDPYATLVVTTKEFFGAWVQIEGPATVLRQPEVMEPLVEYYRSIVGEHPNWQEYREAMVKEQRVLLVIDPVRVGPNLAG